MGGSSGEEMWRYDAEVIMAGKLFEINKKKKKAANATNTRAKSGAILKSRLENIGTAWRFNFSENSLRVSKREVQF